MESDDVGLQEAGVLGAGLRRLPGGLLAQPDAVRLAAQGPVSGALRYGFHSHDAWELFCPLGLLRVLVAAYAEVADSTLQEPVAAGELRVTNALDYLQAHYYQPGLSLAEVAAAVGLSPSHLSCLFRQVTGRSLHQTLIDIRLRRAEALPEQPGQTIEQIAALTGWSNQLYFSAAFRRRYGRPPSAVRDRFVESLVAVCFRRPFQGTGQAQCQPTSPRGRRQPTGGSQDA